MCLNVAGNLKVKVEDEEKIFQVPRIQWVLYLLIQFPLLPFKMMRITFLFPCSFQVAQKFEGYLWNYIQRIDTMFSFFLL